MWQNVGFKVLCLVFYIRLKKVLIKALEVLFRVPCKKHYIIFDFGKGDLDRRLREVRLKNLKYARFRNEIIISRMCLIICVLSYILAFLVFIYTKDLLW